jgi:glycosyltransferase involved in cell wall biosynthesis
MTVSVVMPCYNVERYVESSLRSALSQAYPHVEVIAVDDGSTDGTLAVLEGIAAKHPDTVRVVRQENKGATAARNRGLEEATGEYVQFLDADDLILAAKLWKQMVLVENHGRPALVVGSYRTLEPNGQVRKETVQRGQDRDVWLDLLRTKLGITSANLFRRDAVVAAGGWNETLRSSQEYDLMFRMLAQGAKVVFDPDVNTVIRKRQSGSISRTNLADNWRRYVDLRRRIMEHMEQHGLVRDRQRSAQFVFDSIRVLYEHDQELALRLHRELIPKSFRPSRSAATGPFYLTAYRLLGFRAAQRIWGPLRRAIH